MSTTPPPPPPPGGGEPPPHSSPGPTGGPPPEQGGPPFEPAGAPADSPPPKRNSVAIAALVLGLIAFPGVLLIGVVPIVNLLTILTPLLAIAAIILGILGISRARRPTVAGGVGMGVTGIVLGAINLLLAAAVIAGAVLFVRACPGLTDATTPEEAVQYALECAEDEGMLGPGEVDQLEDNLDQQLDQELGN